MYVMHITLAMDLFKGLTQLGADCIVVDSMHAKIVRLFLIKGHVILSTSHTCRIMVHVVGFNAVL